MLIEGPTNPPVLAPAPEVKRVPRKRRWWNRKATDAEVFRGAIDVIDERGWATGAWVQPRGVCILGAIGLSALEGGRGRRYPGVPLRLDQLAMLAAENVVGDSQEKSLWSWNDMVARDAGEVKAKLLSLAEAAEANGGKHRRY